MSNKMIENLKKLHSAQAVEKKDFSLADCFDSKTKEVVLSITGLASKFVPKYKNENNPGFHTMMYLKDGQKTGAFSTALHEFASFFYEKAGLDPEEKFNKIMFNGSIDVKVSKIALDGGRGTYNFEIIDGDATGAERMGQLAGGGIALLPEVTTEAAEPNTGEEKKYPTDETPKKSRK